MNKMNFFGDFRTQSDVSVFDETVLEELQIGSSSKGNQKKWYDNSNKLFIKSAFYYEDKYWRDYLVEVIASTLASQMKLKQVRVIQQNLCKIKSKNETLNGVFSKDFRETDSQNFIPYYRLLRLHGMEDIVIGFPGKRFQIVVDSLYGLTGLDTTDYLIVMILLDFLVGNEDRHLNNFGVISDKGKFILAPLFDFGLGMFEHSNVYIGRTLQQAIDLMQMKPFCANPIGIINWLKNNFSEKMYSFLPESFDVAGVVFPSPLAKEYFMWACSELEVGVCD